ncbi:YceD family protein [Citricoccus sp.]|uniref:YceD family protein n=1 Tax=Citricoccus sp. TaxID=1978372 RepID=UPI0028BE5990|nr:YceD family protein [Citricoccus sp.]
MSASSSPTVAGAADRWVVSVKDLVRSPGSMRTLEEQWPAPEALSTPLIGIPAGSAVDVDLRLESVHEGILITGEAHAELVGECSRCLDPIQDGITVDLQELFLASAPEGGSDEERLVVHETVDLEPVLRDAVVTALPFQPVCRPECQGLCSECGIRLEDAPDDHVHEQLDPRWAALAELTKTSESGTAGPETKTSSDETEER